jgi:hypothetical protein
MLHRGSIGVVVLGITLSASVVAAQDFHRYREFELGSTVAAVSALTTVAGSELKLIHQRPAVIQELTWKPRYGAPRPGATDTTSVDQIVFDFHGDRLFRVTVDYDRRHTEGLLDADMIAALSTIYGPPTAPSASRRRQPVGADDDSGALVAEWGNADTSVRLHRLSSSGTAFRLVIASAADAALANTDAARAVALDASEAPAREAAREQQAADDRRAAEESARSTNKAAFRP